MTYVLLLEPNTLLAKTYTQLFEHVGYAVGHATGAQEALAIADKRTPDVVVLELQLPMHSGVEFLHEFRSYSEWLKIPVVVNTLSPPSRLAALYVALQNDLGVTALLYKPQTSLQVLLRTMRQQLAQI